MELKPEALELDGREMLLRPMWVGEEDENYPGEWAMAMLPPYDEHPIAWIASGDVEVIGQVQMKATG